MKIVHYPGSFLPQIGGAEIIVHNLATAQAECGHSVYVIAPNFKNNHKKDMGPLKYKILRPVKFSFSIVQRLSKNYGILDFFLEKQIQRFQYEHDFDIWHFNLLGSNNLKAAKTLSEMGVPIVGTFRGSDIQYYPEVSYGQRRDIDYDKLLRKNIGYFDSLTAISNSIIQEYLKLSVKEERIKHIPNFIDLSRYQKKSFEKSNIRKKYNLPRNDKLILTVGRNHKKKGYMLIPDIVAELKKKYKSFKWIIIGKDCQNIKQKAKIKY